MAMKLTLAITTYQRTDLLYESYSKVIDHPLISEVVIVDDCSNDNVWEHLKKNCIHPKIKLYRNEQNLNMSRNKREAISKASNEWAIILDSDNILYPEYLDAVEKTWLNDEARSWYGQDVIMCPSFAEPDFNFKDYSDLMIDKDNAKNFLQDGMFRVFLNTCNYVVNRDEYLKVYKYDETIKESDTIYFNTLWMQAGNAFYVVPGMKYHHRKHSGSGWLNGDHRYNMNKAAELQEKIKNL